MLEPSIVEILNGARRRTEQASNGCSVTVLGRPSRWNGSTPPAASSLSARPSLGSSTGYPKPAPEGRTEIVLPPIQLLERIARLIPPPRVHRQRYHGVLDPNAKLRAAVTCIGRPEAETPAAQLPNPTSSRPRPKPPIDPDVGSRSSAGRLPPRPDSGLRPHRGRART